MTLRRGSINPVAESEHAVSVYVIMGAAVWPDGRASRAMKRRVEGALQSAQGVLNFVFLVSGGVGKNPPSEATVMSSLLQKAGIPEHAIILEEASKDTLQSVRNSIRLIRALPIVRDITICSDVYHVPRCRWLFKLSGISTRAGQMRSGRSETYLIRWLYFYLREVAALPWDTFVLLARR